MKKLLEKVQEDIKIYQFPEIKNHDLIYRGFVLDYDDDDDNDNDLFIFWSIVSAQCQTQNKN